MKFIVALALFLPLVAHAKERPGKHTIPTAAPAIERDWHLLIQRKGRDTSFPRLNPSLPLEEPVGDYAVLIIGHLTQQECESKKDAVLHTGDAAHDREDLDWNSIYEQEHAITDDDFHRLYHNEWDGDVAVLITDIYQYGWSDFRAQCFQ